MSGELVLEALSADFSFDEALRPARAFAARRSIVAFVARLFTRQAEQQRAERGHHDRYALVRAWRLEQCLLLLRRDECARQDVGELPRVLCVPGSVEQLRTAFFDRRR